VNAFFGSLLAFMPAWILRDKRQRGGRCSREKPSWIRISQSAANSANNLLTTRSLTKNLAEREGFIPPPKEHEFQRLLNFPEYPYLRKYLALKRQFGGPIRKVRVDSTI
jgi:hypothetical protein